jgi:tyrosine aminotransferase
MTHTSSLVVYIIYSLCGSLQHVQAGAQRLAQVLLGACHLMQKAIPSLLCPRNAKITEWKHHVHSTIREQAYALCDALRRIGPCFDVIKPEGAMYAMVRINLQYFDSNVIRNDVDFMTLLLREENVIVLPGSCFHFPNSFRVVFCAHISILQEAANRISQFCHRHCSDGANMKEKGRCL